MQANTIHIILNPVAGGGRAGQHLDLIRSEIRRCFADRAELHLTSSKGDATTIARNLAQQNAALIIAGGGDGTIHEVVNGLYDGNTQTFSECVLGILNFGSGGGCAESLEIPAGISEQFDLIARPGCTPIDVGHINYESDENGELSRVFINEFQLGIGAEVVANTNGKLKLLGGALAYGLTTIKAALTFKGPQLELSLSNGLSYSGRYLGVVIGNGAYCAGGMQLTPDASVHDGLLDILLMHAMSVPQRLVNFPKIYTGKHVHSKSFSCQKSTSITIHSDVLIRAEADGEMFALRTCQVDVLPSALKVKRPQNLNQVS